MASAIPFNIFQKDAPFTPPIFLFERKIGKKNQKTCRFIALSVQPKARKNAL
jgi:hypothetical protein